MASAFDEVVKNLHNPDNSLRISKKETFSILPARKTDINVPAAHLNNSIAKLAGDCFWQCGVELAKILYIKIDERYPAATRSNLDTSRYYAAKMGSVKKHLQEQRNLIFEDVLPMFVVSQRSSSDEEYTPADIAAHNFFLKNCFFTLEKTYLAWIPEYVEKDQVESVSEVVQNIGSLQAEILSRKLKNFKFAYRPLLIK